MNRNETAEIDAVFASFNAYKRQKSKECVLDLLDILSDDNFYSEFYSNKKFCNLKLLRQAV